MQVPSIVGVTSLEHSTSSAGGITTTLKDHFLKEGLVGHVIVHVDIIGDCVTTLEVTQLVGTSADRGIVGFLAIGIFASGSTDALLKLFLLQYITV